MIETFFGVLTALLFSAAIMIGVAAMCFVIVMLVIASNVWLLVIALWLALAGFLYVDMAQ